MSQFVIRTLVVHCLQNAMQDHTPRGKLLSLRNALSYGNRLEPSERKAKLISGLFTAMNSLKV